MSTRATQIRQMFATIAPRYDIANTVLSGGLHHGWRKAAIDALDAAPDAQVLDVCSGTGDVAFEILERLGDRGGVVATDFCEQMLERAREKTRDSRIRFQVADATELPFEASSFDGATVAFGIRNVVDPVRALEEMARVVRPGGRIVVLEFGQPDGPVFGPVYRAYSRWVMPMVGKVVTGHRDPYEYLPETAAAFPAGEDFLEQMMRPAGLIECTATPLTLGVAWVYVGRSSSHPGGHA